MEARLKSEILNYKKALSKSLKELQHEHVNDILVAMVPLSLTADLIQSTRIGHLVAEIKKNYSTQSSDITNTIVENTKVLLVQWKRIIESTTKSSKPTSSHASEAAHSSVDAESLGEQRQKVLELFVTIFAQSNESGAKSSSSSSSSAPSAFVVRKARDLESAINDGYPYDVNNKTYAGKARTLAFNLKRNKPLLDSFFGNGVSPSQLVNLSAEELANQEVVERRKTAQQEDSDERRLDWLDEHRSQIQKEIGIAPTEFVYEELSLSDNDD